MRRKWLLALLSVLGAAAVAFAVFYFTRPVVAFVMPDTGRRYFSHLQKPRALTLHYRSVFAEPDEISKYENADLIINHSGIGMENLDNVYNVEYDPMALFQPVLEEYPPESLLVLYDEQDEVESAFVEEVLAGYPGADSIPYRGSMDRTDYAVNKSRTGPGTILVVLDARDVFGFLLYLDDPRFVVDYIDAAALDVLEPERTAVPDWDKIISAHI